MENQYQTPEQIRYLEARKKVHRIRGFYIHLIVYIAVNLMIVVINVQNLKEGESYFKLENFFTAFFWGIGLLAHAASVFLPHFILGRNWEERKIREFMEEDKNKY